MSCKASRLRSTSSSWSSSWKKRRRPQGSWRTQKSTHSLSASWCVSQHLWRVRHTLRDLLSIVTQLCLLLAAWSICTRLKTFWGSQFKLPSRSCSKTCQQRAMESSCSRKWLMNCLLRKESKPARLRTSFSNIQTTWACSWPSDTLSLAKSTKIRALRSSSISVWTLWPRTRISKSSRLSQASQYTSTQDCTTVCLFWSVRFTWSTAAAPNCDYSRSRNLPRLSSMKTFSMRMSTLRSRAVPPNLSSSILDSSSGRCSVYRPLLESQRRK